MKWKLLPKKSDDLVNQLLVNRGIKTLKEREQFFHPKLNDFKKELEISGNKKANQRIKKAIKTQELIVVHGDYDVDGIAGAATLYLGLTKLGAKVLPFIPHREKEGYGLSTTGLDFARDSGASLVISVDCGIVNFKEAEYAKSLGLTLIITDHHQPVDKKLPKAYAIVHATHLCGTAVAWTLIKDEELLDLVALATISDMMPLLGVNRALVKVGLEKLNKTERVGLLELFQEAGILPGEIGSYEIGHIIAPRLNAMGRLEHAIDSLRLLCTKDPAKAKKLAAVLSETNSLRQNLTQRAVDEARLMTDKNKNIHILSSKSWSQGIIGLVAGRVCDETGCSAVAISVGEEFSKGSARASDGVNIVEVLRACQDILMTVGGHKAAAGFTIETKNLEIFAKKMESLMEGQETKEKELEIELEVSTKELTLDLAKKINQFEPFGIGNPRPILAIPAVVLSDLTTVGKGKHLKGKVVDPERSRRMDFIAFGMGDLINILQNGQMVDLAYTLDIDKWDGTEKVQLKVRDIKIN